MMMALLNEQEICSEIISSSPWREFTPERITATLSQSPADDCLTCTLQKMVFSWDFKLLKEKVMADPFFGYNLSTL